MATTDEQLVRLRRWAARGSMPRLYTELVSKLAADGYELELEGETLTIYGYRKPAGWRGWFRREERQPLLRLERQGNQVSVSDEPLDAAFVPVLLGRLRA